MRTQKKTYNFDEIQPLQKPNPTQTPRDKLQSSNITNINHSRRSVTPTKIQQRINHSPLKLPLSRAIQNIANASNSNVNNTNRSRTPTRSPSRIYDQRLEHKASRRQQSSNFSISRKIFNDEDIQDRQLKMHTQTNKFLKKYFDLNTSRIPSQHFIRCILQQYEGLWGTQNVDQVIQDFTYKIYDMFDSQYIDVRQLSVHTKHDGIIGLILQVFKQIKNEQTTRMSTYSSFIQQPSIMDIHKSFESRIVQQQNLSNIKNVIQQFMETMYQCMQNEIYNKFNVEMRRMVLKYKQSQKMLKKVNQIITTYADVFDMQKKRRQKERNYEQKIQQLKRAKDKQQLVIQKDKQTIKTLKSDLQKLENQNYRLKQNLQKYQNAILNRALENPINADHTLSRRASTSSFLTDKTSQYNNIENNNYNNYESSQSNNRSFKNSQPFKIQIDTHIIHGDNGSRPSIHNVSTFGANPSTNMNVNAPNISNISPSKRQMDKSGVSRSSYGQSKYANINTSPYQSKPFR